MLSFQGGIRVPSYTASKSGCNGDHTPDGKRMGETQNQCKCYRAGYMATNNTQQLRADEQRSAEILDRIPAGRWGLPGDLMGPVVFLASSAADYIKWL
ncbi:2-keto-3-deoxygluconate oxidoreductase [Salmonella bongori]|nr:2-keto-3-deoxygluconate oxidoreductase [Salmonella bongori]